MTISLFVMGLDNMREIKFRGMNFCGKWVYGDLRHDRMCMPDGKLQKYISVCGEPIHPDTVGQFTGLKDSNGKEIYEGDVIVSQSDLISIFELKSPDYVVFHDGAFWLSDSWNRHNCKGTLLAIASVHNEIARCKVIGNIYDNPELLRLTKTGGFEK